MTFSPLHALISNALLHFRGIMSCRPVASHARCIGMHTATSSSHFRTSDEIDGSIVVPSAKRFFEERELAGRNQQTSARFVIVPRARWLANGREMVE